MAAKTNRNDIEAKDAGLVNENEAAAMNPEAAVIAETTVNPETTVNSETAPATNGSMPDAAVIVDAVMNPETASTPVTVDMAAEQINVISGPVTMEAPKPAYVAPPLPAGTGEPGKYEDFLLMPNVAWPAPIFIRKSVSAQERFYLETRWYSQWKYYDNKATQAKNQYFFYQSIVVIGSVIVPVVISFSSALAGIIEGISFLNLQAGQGRAIVDVFTVLTSTFVAISAAVESLQKYGDNWSSYRSAAEELQAEKYFYDMLSGPYINNPNPFATFVERTEGIIANQNGKYFQVVQQQIQKQAADNEELLDRYRAGEEKAKEEENGAAG